MIDFPITEWLDDSHCRLWLERHLHPDGVRCPHGGRTEGRLFRQHRYFPAHRGKAGDGDDPLLTGTACEKTRQRPATLVLLLRGSAKGEPTARVARELGLSRQPVHTLRQRGQATLNDTAPTGFMTGPACEADALDPNAGAKKPPPSRSR